MDSAALLEWSHRTLAAIVSAVIVAAAAVALLHHRSNRLIAVPMLAVLPLLLFQIGLGAVTVILELPPLIVLVHLTIAMILLALVILASLTAIYEPNPTPPARPNTVHRAEDQRRLRLVYWMGLALFLVLLSGAFVRGDRRNVGLLWVSPVQW